MTKTANTGFSDHFSAVAEAYSKGRPQWPDSLFAALADLTPGRELAVEVGCGSGQASLGLAQYFDLVEASDPSASQIARARPHPRVRYSVAPAEDTALEDHCADLLLAAQAAHWFDLDAFFAEARRLLRPGGLLALASYARCTLPVPQCLELLDHFHLNTMAPWWPAERATVDNLYADIAEQMPFEPVPSRQLQLRTDWNLEDLMVYLASWSAVNRYRQSEGRDPLPPLEEAMRAHWPQQGQERLEIRWPITLVLGRQAAHT